MASSFLKKIVLPNNLKIIKSNPVIGCSNLASITCESTRFNAKRKMLIYTINKRLIAYWGKDDKVVIPQGISKIGDYAFCGCKFLAKIELPDSISTIENDAFYECESLTEIYIPKGTRRHFEQLSPSVLHKHLRETSC